MKKTIKDLKILIVAVSGKKKKMVPKYFCFITLFLAFSLSLETQYELMALYIKNVSISCNYCS